MNCKPGQKAIIINSLEQENIGRIVMVVEDWNDRQVHEGKFWPPLSALIGDHLWLVQSECSPISYGSLPGTRGDVIRIESGPYGDSWLRPLLDVSEPATEEAVESKPKEEQEQKDAELQAG